MNQTPSRPGKHFSNSAVAVDFTRDSEVLKVFPSSPLLSSKPEQWNGIHLSYYQHRPHELPETVSSQHLVLVHVETPTWAEQKLDTQLQENQFQVGEILIVPAQMSHFARWDTEHRYLILSLDPSAFLNAVRSAGAWDKAELVPHFATADPLVHGIGLALKNELESNSLGGQLYADSLCIALFNHLIQHYTARKPVLVAHTDGLPSYQLRQVIEYIDAYLDRRLALADLAAIAQMSPSYFTQLFRESTGFTPHQYVIRQRVERARQLLVQRKLPLAEIALQVGFAHQSHLTRHFKRWLGVTPKAFLNSL